VKQTLASSLHEVARILSEAAPNPSGLVSDDGTPEMIGGVGLVEEELIPVFEALLQDVEAVQMGVMRHLADFFARMSSQCRVSYLPLLHDLLHSTNPFNWRLRQCLAVQLPALLDLPPPELVFNTLFPLVMTLLQDPVASVRRNSFKGVAQMLVILFKLCRALDAHNDRAMKLLTQVAIPPASDKGPDAANAICDSSVAELQDIIKDDFDDPHQMNIAITAAHQVDVVAKAINTLVAGDSFQLRQLWAELSLSLLEELPQHLYEKYFLDGLLFLTSDPVSNVRVAVGAVLSGWSQDMAPFQNTASPWTWLLRRPDVRECVKRLSRDDMDVYTAMQKLHPLFPDLTFTAVSCKGLKEAPGGSEPVLNAVTGALFGYSSRRSSLTCDSSLKDSSSCGSTTADVEEYQDIDSNNCSDGVDLRDTSRLQGIDLELELKLEPEEDEEDGGGSSLNQNQEMRWGDYMGLHTLSASDERQSQKLESGREVTVAV
jgi:hypothetical protein